MIDISDVPSGSVPVARTESEKQLLRTLVDSAGPSTRIVRRPRFLIVATLAGLGISGASVAAAYTVLAPRAATVHDSARCYSSVSSNTGSKFPGATVSAAQPTGGSPADSAATALGVCAGLWQRGFLTAAGFAAPNVALDSDGLPPAIYPVPPLVACVLKSGQVAVFPGDASSCGRLGLPTLAGG